MKRWDQEKIDKKGTKGICINTYGDRRKRERERGGAETEGERESPKECDSERNKTIDRRRLGIKGIKEPREERSALSWQRSPS